MVLPVAPESATLNVLVPVYGVALLTATETVFEVVSPLAQLSDPLAAV
jgi:hypothetical protein